MRLEFENCELDVDERTFKRGADQIHVEPQVFDLIVLLASNAERLVRHDEIISDVWRGRIVSDSAVATRVNAARAALGDNGIDQRIIKTVRGHGFRFCVATKSVPDTNTHPETGGDPDAIFGVPSIAALPFAIMPDDSETGFFADGMVEDLIRSLSRFRDLAVISRNTSFSFRDGNSSPSSIGQLLRVKYILSGSVRHARSQLRITVELTETSTGRQIWSERYDREHNDAFDVQDDVSARAVAAIAPQVQFVEMKAASQRNRNDLTAWEKVMRARWHMDKQVRTDTQKALVILEEAKSNSSNLALLHSTQAHCHLHQMINAWVDDPLKEIGRAREAAQQAIELDHEDAGALAIMGLAAMFSGQMDECLELLDKAQHFNPNLAAAYGFRATTYGCLGQLQDTLANHDKALALSPRDIARPFWMSGRGIALFLDGQYKEGLENANRMLSVQSGYGPALRQKAACHAMLTQHDEARRTLAKIQEAMPGLSIKRVQEMVPIVNPDDQDRWLGALRVAGLPE